MFDEEDYQIWRRTVDEKLIRFDEWQKFADVIAKELKDERSEWRDKLEARFAKIERIVYIGIGILMAGQAMIIAAVQWKH